MTCFLVFTGVRCSLSTGIRAYSDWGESESFEDGFVYHATVGSFRANPFGLYDVHVKIPSETGYGWLVEPALVMDEDLTRAYRLVPPIPIEGLVRASDGTAVPGASIRAFVLTTDGVPSRPIQVAETVSDEDGNYRLLITP